jgi:hypothetical protein
VNCWFFQKSVSQIIAAAKIKRNPLKLSGSISFKLLLMIEKFNAHMNATRKREISTIVRFFKKDFARLMW